MSACKRCGGKLGYPGAEYCGAACSAQRDDAIAKAVALLKSKGVTCEDYARFLAEDGVSP